MEPSPSQADSPLVLVVDDDDDTRANLSDILELDGYRVQTAASARELLGPRDWSDVELVLLDRKLPDGSPQELVPKLHELSPRAAIIIVTGYADIEGAIAALRSGAADYILKPVNPDALRASIQRVFARQQAEERYRSLFENSLDGLLMISGDGRIVAVNPAACAILGREETALVDARLESLQLSLPNVPGTATGADLYSEPTKIGEAALLRGDGTLVSLEFRAVRGFAPGLHLLSLHDVTARKEAEERARQSERLAAIGETMAALVHESRNALQRSKASLEMLALEVEDRPQAVKLIERAQKAQEDLHRLYEEVRQWAAPLTLRREPTDLRELWQEAWCLVKQAHPARDVRLVEEIHCREPTCDADPFLLTQVLRNVFENALEVAPNGSAITVRCHELKSTGEIVLSIHDQGPGFTPQQERRIFEPFFTTKTKGTGLGMAIAQRIVHSHRGEITARSPGGAEIEIKLPRAP